MSQRQPIHICFYSNRCKWSKAFLQELSQTPWKGDFRFVCADPSPTRPKLPDWLKSVPTIVISGEPEPRVGADVMNWLYEKKMKEAVTTTEKKSSPGPGAGGDPAAWSMFENTSFNKSFGYSFNDSDTSTSGDGGLMITGAFSLLNGAASVGDRASQEFPGAAAVQTGRSRSKKEELFDKQMEAYQRSRDDGVPKTAARQ